MNWEKFRQKLKPISEGLFGKQKTPTYQKQHYKIRPLDYMLKNLTAIPDLEWYKYAFSREPLNGKFDDFQKKFLMQKSIDCGKDYALKIIEKYKTDDSEKIANFLNLDVKYPQYPDKTDRVLFADFAPPNHLQIFMDAVYRANKYLKNSEIKEILSEKFKPVKIILSHEIFHFIEEIYKNEIFTKTEKIRLWSIGPLHNDSGIFALGEIAAMSFAKELNHLDFFPYVIDVFMAYDYSEEEASGLYEEMMEFAGLNP